MKKKESLYTAKEKKAPIDIKSMNIFQKEQFVKEHTVPSGNGSNKLSSTGNLFVDQFGQISQYKNCREADAIFADNAALWNVNPMTTLHIMGYIRCITRDAKLPDGTKLGVQIGQGLKHEYFHRLYWLGIHHPNTFKANLDVWVTLGSWDDLFELLRLDIEYDHEGRQTLLDWNYILGYIVRGLANDQVTNLIKKYLPTIKTVAKCKTLRNQANNYIAKRLCKVLWPEEKDPAIVGRKYRLLKASGTAHEFQQLISQGRYNEINFKLVPGRVLGQMAKPRFTITKNGKKVKSDGTSFVERHGLAAKYDEFLDSQPIAKFTGFVYELFQQLIEDRGWSFNYKYTSRQARTINKQFEGLIETARKSMTDTSARFIVAVDSSSSMYAHCEGTPASAYTVARSMALYFSELLTGPFANTCLDFNSDVEVVTWTGNTPVEKFVGTHFSGYCGSTNPLSVARLFVTLFKKGYNIGDFPTGVLMVSDGNFDRGSSNGTIFDEFKEILRIGGFPKDYLDNFQLILWDVPNSYYGATSKTTRFEGLADHPNYFYMSGFDGAGVKFLLGKEPTSPNETVKKPANAEELFQAAMDQELLNKLVVARDFVKKSNTQSKKPNAKKASHKTSKTVK